MNKKLLIMPMAGIMLVAHGQVAQPKLTYPKAHKGDVVDTYFGIGVPDPYRWLENDTSEATAAWVAAENKVTDEYLSKIPFRSALLKRLTDLSDYERMSLPSKKNGKYYFYKNDGLQNQDVLYVQDSLDGEPRVLLDPNKLSADGTVALTGTSLSLHHIAQRVRLGRDIRNRREDGPAARRPHSLGQVHRGLVARRRLLLQRIRRARERQGIL